MHTIVKVISVLFLCGVWFMTGFTYLMFQPNIKPENTLAKMWEVVKNSVIMGPFIVFVGMLELYDWLTKKT